MPMRISIFIFPFSIVALFLLAIIYPTSDHRIAPLIQMQYVTRSRAFQPDEYNLELILEGHDPVSLKLGRLLHELSNADHPTETGIPAMLIERSYKEKVLEVLESNSIQYSVVYPDPRSLASVFVSAFHTHERVSSIKARVFSFQKPFFSTKGIEIVIYIWDDDSYHGHSISG